MKQQRIIATYQQLISASAEASQACWGSKGLNRQYYYKKIHAIHLWILDGASASEMKSFRRNVGSDWTQALTTAIITPNTVQSQSNQVYYTAILMSDQPLTIYISENNMQMFLNQTNMILKNSSNKVKKNF